MMRRSLLILAIVLTAAFTSPRAAFAVKVSDVSHLAGARINALTGVGIVIGLKGTGDDDSCLPTIGLLGRMLSEFGDPAWAPDLTNAKNVAMVTVSASMPIDGVHVGDHLDVRVTCIGTATSLRGGTLYMTPLTGPDGQRYTPHDSQGHALKPIHFALANGSVELSKDSAATSGLVRAGAVMEVDLPAKFVDERGRFTLALDGPAATWATALAIAEQINRLGVNGESVAVAIDPTSIIVQIPQVHRRWPDLFVAAVLQQELPAPRTRAEERARIEAGQRDALSRVVKFIKMF